MKRRKSTGMTLQQVLLTLTAPPYSLTKETIAELMSVPTSYVTGWMTGSLNHYDAKRHDNVMLDILLATQALAKHPDYRGKVNAALALDAPAPRFDGDVNRTIGRYIKSGHSDRVRDMCDQLGNGLGRLLHAS